MVVRLLLVVEVTHCFLQFFGFRFECFQPLLDLRVLVTVLLDGHWNSPSRAEENTSLGLAKFQISGFRFFGYVSAIA